MRHEIMACAQLVLGSLGKVLYFLEDFRASEAEVATPTGFEPVFLP